VLVEPGTSTSRVLRHAVVLDLSQVPLSRVLRHAGLVGKFSIRVLRHVVLKSGTSIQEVLRHAVVLVEPEYLPYQGSSPDPRWFLIESILPPSEFSRHTVVLVESGTYQEFSRHAVVLVGAQVPLSRVLRHAVVLVEPGTSIKSSQTRCGVG
ncbi:hypothetical protein RRG08_057705, partial [Elysia crispata]